MKINKNKEKKNILFYCPFIERGGIRTTLIKYANFLSEKYNVKIFTETTDSLQLSKFNKKIEIYQPKKSLLSVYNLQSRSSRVISFES